MSIFDQIKDLEAQIKEAEAESEIDEQEVPVVEEEPEDEVVEQEEPAEEPETAQDDSKKEEEEKPSSEFYRLRRENAKLKKQLEDSAAQRSEPTQQNAPIEDPVLRELYFEKLQRDAANEFVALEQPFAQAHADYEDISEQYKASVYNSLRIFNPSLSHDQLLKQTATVILQKAGNYKAAGLDPIEELYNEAKSLGFKQREARPAEKAKQIKPDLAKVAENKRRNASVAAVGSSATPDYTPSSVAKYTPAEWQALPNDVKRKLLAE